MTAQPAHLREASLRYLTGAGSALPRPSAVGEKFTETGAVLSFAGNTFICHIPPDGAAHAALTHAQARLQAGPLAGAFTFLPPSSFHMTVFEGICDAHRHDDRWPQDVDPALSVDAVSAQFLPQVQGLPLPVASMVRAHGIFGGFSVSLTGATPAEDAALRAARDTLAAATGIHRANHDAYEFHITLAYLIRWLTADEAAQVMDLAADVHADLLLAAPGIALAGVEFCRFDDMHAFPLLERLS